MTVLTPLKRLCPLLNNQDWTAALDAADWVLDGAREVALKLKEGTKYPFTGSIIGDSSWNTFGDTFNIGASLNPLAFQRGDTVRFWISNAAVWSSKFSEKWSGFLPLHSRPSSDDNPWPSILYDEGPWEVVDDEISFDCQKSGYVNKEKQMIISLTTSISCLLRLKRRRNKTNDQTVGANFPYSFTSDQEDIDPKQSPIFTFTSFGIEPQATVMTDPVVTVRAPTDSDDWVEL